MRRKADNIEKLEWFSGINDYKKHTLIYNRKNKITDFTITLINQKPISIGNINECFRNHLLDKTYTVEILYSGGIDSESVVIWCIKNKIPFKIVTGRWLYKGNFVNKYDLHCVDQLCSERNLKPIYIDLNIETFFNNGDHLPFLDPYKITSFTASTLFWLIDQCKTFPIIGGDYTWPMISDDQITFNPHRSAYNCFDHYMYSKGISGIGNMLSHSQDSNLTFIHSHLNPKNYTKLKIFQSLGFTELSERVKTTGWEDVFEGKTNINWKEVSSFLVTRYGITKNHIEYGSNFKLTV